jgi:uncharacterized protein YqhQ
VRIITWSVETYDLFGSGELVFGHFRSVSNLRFSVLNGVYRKKERETISDIHSTMSNQSAVCMYMHQSVFNKKRQKTTNLSEYVSLCARLISLVLGRFLRNVKPHFLDRFRCCLDWLDVMSSAE